MYDLCGYTMRSLAKTFGLSTPTVRAIVRGSYGKKEAAK
jgi:lambda repressor-like predicted transcriptional regulator